PHHYWCYLGEVVADSSDTARTLVTSEDKSGQRIRVEFHFDDTAEFDYESVKVGSTIVVLYAEQHIFEDGNPGLHLEHPKFVKIFPCGLETLLRISDDIESETPDNCAQRYKTCGKEDTPDRITLQRCSQCLGASYCGQVCVSHDLSYLYLMDFTLGMSNKCRARSRVRYIQGSCTSATQSSMGQFPGECSEQMDWFWGA
ncbi:hypothetical protein C8J57DRAFT_1079306, partial [Mycena rebaudengoi]